MRNAYHINWLGCMFVLLSACSVEESKTSGFFDAKRYFGAVADSLSETQTGLEKTMITTGASETVIDSHPVWRNELLPFMELDITKSAMKASYDADTIRDGNGLTIRYQATDAYVPIRNMEVKEDSHGRVISIHAIVRSKNPYHRSADTLQFQIGAGYRISALSEPFIGDKIQFSLTGKFIHSEAPLK